MSQSRAASVVEANVNILVGFVLAMVTWQIVGPWFGYVITLHDNVQITMIFAVVSFVRGYAVRRFFNWLGNR